MNATYQYEHNNVALLDPFQVSFTLEADIA